MSLLVESIKIYDSRRYLLSWHEARVQKSIMSVFGSNKTLNLNKHVVVPEQYKKGLVKCRILYDQNIQSINFSPYSIRKIESLQLVYDDNIVYPYKWLERPALDHLYDGKKGADEIIIVKNNQITDAYYYNLVLQKGNVFESPKCPLLEGCQRAYLLSKNKIILKNILIEDLAAYDFIHLINAMTPLGAIRISTKNILY